jgi:hypothetical protein
LGGAVVAGRPHLLLTRAPAVAYSAAMISGLVLLNGGWWRWHSFAGAACLRPETS